jgi:hypothetical protein
MADAAVGCIMLSCGGPRSVLIERECSGVGVGRTKSGICMMCCGELLAGLGRIRYLVIGSDSEMRGERRRKHSLSEGLCGTHHMIANKIQMEAFYYLLLHSSLGLGKPAMSRRRVKESWISFRSEPSLQI